MAPSNGISKRSWFSFMSLFGCLKSSGYHLILRMRPITPCYGSFIFSVLSNFHVVVIAMNEDELKRILTTKDIDISLGHRKLDEFLKEIQVTQPLAHISCKCCNSVMSAVIALLTETKIFNKLIVLCLLS
jgi:hypothetical protein